MGWFPTLLLQMIVGGLLLSTVGALALWVKRCPAVAQTGMVGGAGR